MRIKGICLLCVLLLCAQLACAEEYALTPEPKGATEITAQKNQEVYAILDFEDEQEMEFATRGLICAPDSLELTDAEGRVIWSQDAYAFVEDAEAPDTVNPSLWRNTQLNHIYGLFEVTDGIYQVRGYDMSNITFIKGDTGWIVFDPLMSVECAQAAMQLVDAQLGEYPIMAVVYSHTHVDHFGGVKGIVSEEEVAQGQIPIIAPEGFEEYAVSENVYAGTGMGRRASYQYGTLLDTDAQGSLCIGIGMGQSKGTISYIAPTDWITESGETRVIDGVTMEFQLTPGTEAPAEMNTWFPEKKALWMAENCTGTLHNLYTLRGAQVRDGNAWACYIMEALSLYGEEAEVVFQSHNWPHWGNDVIREYMENTAAVYKFINDQTLFYINQGYTADEIADAIELPEELEKVWYTRQYYGTLKHNAKAVYQKYMGWYDANPIHLDALAPQEYATKLVEYLGDTDRVLELAKEDFAAGEYQWVAEITNALVFADPENLQARYLCADALEQLGYQAESGPWRNAYLTAAQELREGSLDRPEARASGSGEVQQNMDVELMLDYLGIRLDSNAAQDLNCRINLIITDLGEEYLLTMRSGVLLYQKDAQAEDAEATWKMPKAGLFALLQGNAETARQVTEIEGDAALIDALCENVLVFYPFFNIIEP
ncbi:MAG TPA: MBL fold metallo-hydrolase [Candidatus Pullichristensenella excrementigallinarum]|uniref:MBL fold metallo-hydrolase n=1 Tax=Candidatus Pullichristensenella excrementigallinarum TaxID=2840907 RepID=A0A9D1IEI4_9FIRM|nr:MBL fold metallo-hydrolase [Candidatus Pullichristensenella excrementigallinarum]